MALKDGWLDKEMGKQKTITSVNKKGSDLTSSLEIGDISNYYGGLKIRKLNGICYWSIGNHDGEHWRIIPDSLYQALSNYEDERNSE